MTGMELKAKITPSGKSISEVARMIGLSQQGLSQALSTKDVKTGLIEKIATALGLPLSYFYGDGTDGRAIANGNRAIAAVNSTISEQSEKAILEEKVRGMQKLLEEKERVIQAYEKMVTMKTHLQQKDSQYT